MSGKKGAKFHRWSDSEKAYLAEITPGRSHADIREMMTDRFGDHFGGKRIGAAIKRYHLNTGRNGCFEKGHEPANKGKTWDEFMPKESQERSLRTCFKSGNRPMNHRPVGSERTGKDGYIWIKVSDDVDPNGKNDWRDLWIPKSRAVWERENGSLPDGMMVVFADGDIYNFEPDNLVAMTKAQHAVICHENIAYHNRNTCIAAIAIADLQSKIYDRSCYERTCPVCGRSFRPDQPRQVRCRGCIDERRAS